MADGSAGFLNGGRERKMWITGPLTFSAQKFHFLV